jgi:hypothetical protein
MYLVRHQAFDISVPSLSTQLVDKNAILEFVVLLAIPAFAAPTVSHAACLQHDRELTDGDIQLAP